MFDAKYALLAFFALATPAWAQTGSSDSGSWTIQRVGSSCVLGTRLGGAKLEFSRSSTSDRTFVTFHPQPLPGRDPANPYAGRVLQFDSVPASPIAVTRGQGGAFAAFDSTAFAAMLAKRSIRISETPASESDMDVPLPRAEFVERDFATCLTALRAAERGSGELAVVAPQPKAQPASWLAYGSFEFKLRFEA